MKAFAINYAYNGFLYAPLFLAKETNLLPRGATLVPRYGDIEAAGALGRWDDEYPNWFAICDPFAHGISAPHDLSRIAHLAGTKDDPLCIIGAFVGKLPVWLYNIDPKFGPFHSEEELKKEAGRITRIVCYKKFNTGYLIGKHICDLIDRDSYPEMLHPVEFGEEFTGIQPSDLVVTSDVLAVAQSLKAHDNNVVLSMFTGCCDLDPFLFTAILTRRSVVDNELPTVLSVLAGLRTAVHHFETNRIGENELDILLAHFQKEMPHVNKTYLRHGIKLLCDDRIYSGDLDIDTAERGYKNASKEWLRALGKEYSPVEKQKEPIPSLLIRADWRNHSGLAAAFAETWKPSNSNGFGTSAIKAVAETWKDDDTAIEAVATTWVANERSKRALARIMPRTQPTKDQAPLVWPTAISQASLIILATIACWSAKQLTSAWPILVAVGLLMVSSLILISYLPIRQRDARFWWIIGLSYIAQIVCTIPVCRDTIVAKKEELWGHSEAWAAAIGVALSFVVGAAIAESRKTNTSQIETSEHEVANQDGTA